MISAASTARMTATGALLAVLALACHAQVETHAMVSAEAHGRSYLPGAVEYDDTDPVCLSTFEGTLSPYGTWLDDAEFGYVWVPDPVVVGVGFRPYLSAGQWAYTEHGYFWVSDHSWGWVTFHYGRWVDSARWGWVWVPGARYSPAWVEWRYGGGFLGWAPARPSFHWRGGVAYWVEAPPASYVFVHSSAVFAPFLTVVVAPPEHHDALMAGTIRWVSAGPHPFVGPDPLVVGIPKAEVVRATQPLPTHVLPRAVPWGKAPPALPKPHKPPPIEPKAAPTPPAPELVPLPPKPKPPEVGPKPKAPQVVPLPPPKTPKPKVKPAPDKAPKPKPFS